MHIKQPATLLAILILFTVNGNAQDFPKKFRDLGAKNDTTAQLTLLKDWEAARPKDVELYVSWFNFYVKKSMQDLVTLEENPQKEALQLTDSAGKVVGYLNSSSQHRPDLLQKAFEYIDKGINIHPTRLDMRFGKIYLLGQVGNFEQFTKTIIETLEYGNSVKYAWLWKDGETLENPRSFLIESMQDYINTIYSAENDSLLPYMRQISEAVLKYEPEHVISLANIALTYAIEQDYDKALPYLFKAEKINPKDVIVLNNIAEIYVRKKDNANAKKYYEKIIKAGTKEDADHARERIKELN